MTTEQKEQVEKIKAEVSIVELIGRDIKLKKNGANYIGKCPFHNERSPSFIVSPAKGIYKCFGCGASGDIFTFVEKYHNKDFKETLELLAPGLQPLIKQEPVKKRTSFKTTKMQHPKKQDNSASNATALPQAPKEIPGNIMRQTLQQYALQPLFLWFVDHFSYNAALAVFRIYNVGTAKDGGTIFWQVDLYGRPAMAQKIIYTGFKRSKETPPVRLYKFNDGFKGCFFGEHLLGIYDKMRINPVVCIVESEKTAMIASLYLPSLTRKDDTERPACWIASVGSNGITDDKLPVLKGRDVILFPDFKYLNRAQWGSRPMCKKEIQEEYLHYEQEVAYKRMRTRTIISEDGIFDPDFKSAKDRILAAGAKTCNVFDVAPALENGDDLADYLIQEPRFVNYQQPKFDNFRICKENLEVKVYDNDGIEIKTYEEGIEVKTYEPTIIHPQPGAPGFNNFVVNKLTTDYPLVGELIERLKLKVFKVEAL